MRIQALEGYAQRVLNLTVNPDYQSMIAVKHLGSTGENEHYHLVVKTTVKQQAFRVRMKNVFDKGKGNEHMSIKMWDGNIDAVSYLFHEDTDKYQTPIIACKEVSEETIEKARRRNCEVQEKMAKAKSRASWTIEQELLHHYEQTKVKPDTYTIAKDIVLHALRNDKYVPNDYQLKAMASKITFKLLEGDLNREEKFAIDYIVKAYRMDEEERRWAFAGGGMSVR